MKMDLRPIPKPRSAYNVQPVPAPRTNLSSLSPAYSINPSLIENSKTSGAQMSSFESQTSISNEYVLKSFGTSSRELKDEISEKMAVKDKTVMSTTRNASSSSEKSMKNLLTRRSIPSQDGHTMVNNREKKEEKCISLPASDDIFSSISFNSPLRPNLKSVNNEEDLSEARYSLPPPIYPPPPFPDESIYDKLKFDNTGYSNKCNTVGSMVLKSHQYFSENFDPLDGSENCKSNLHQSFNISAITRDTAERLSRSDSWIYYDSIRDKLSTGIILGEEEELDEASGTLQSNSSILSVRNSLYENWNPIEIRNTLGLRLNNKSVLFEFDPFPKVVNNTQSNYDNNDLILLETLFSTSQATSSNGSMTDLRENSEDCEEPQNEVKYSPPPAPPRRYDSLPNNEYDEVEVEEVPQLSDMLRKNSTISQELLDLGKQKQSVGSPKTPLMKNSNHISSENSISQLKSPDNRTSSVIQKLKKLHNSTVHVRPVLNFMKNKKLLRYKESDSSMKTSAKDIKMTKPKVNVQIVPVCHRGIVYCPGVGIERTKELVMRTAVLADQKISFYTDKGMSTIKEVLLLDNVQSIHLSQDVKVVDGESVHCVAVSGQGKSGVHIFYAKSITERRIWAQRIVEALTPIFPIKYTSDLIRAGWAYLKEGVTGMWFSAWVLLQQRTLIYTRSLEPLDFEKLDLRKARCILIRDLEGPVPNSGTDPVLVIDSGRRAALHLTAPGTREVPAWRHAVYQAAISCGPALCDQQLTAEDVPVIVDKCINFIYTHGIMSEGIYRKGGSSSAVVRLLETFRRDAWATQITRGLYSEHDVATVLRRFLRDLPEPLLSPSIHEQFCQVIDIQDDDERVEAYRATLFPVLNQVAGSTLRRILAHLHCLSQQSSRNRMTVENISAVWGPTLMHAGRKSAEEWNKSETNVVGDLIRFYPKLYQLSAADLAKEAKILEVLERHHISNSALRGAPSGDLKIWIYLFEKTGECCNVTIGPQKTASDVCRELSEKSQLPAHELCLEEYTLGGALRRPLHHAEKVLEVIARWGYYVLEDRKDNILILKRDTLYRNMISRIKPPMIVSGELKFADTKTKCFKNYTFEFSQAKLCCYKDKACAVKLHEWKIEDIIWFLGHEPKRNPLMGWSITFILKNEKPTRTKDAPFFGYILAGAPPVDQYKWLAAMLFGEHQLNLLPSVVNLMDP